MLSTMTRHDHFNGTRSLSARACATWVLVSVIGLALLALSARVASDVPMFDIELDAQMLLLASCSAFGVIAALIVLKARSLWFLPLIMLMIWVSGPLANTAVFALGEDASQRDLLLASYHRLWHLQAGWKDTLGPAVVLLSVGATTHLSLLVWRRFVAGSDAVRNGRIALLAALPALTVMGGLTLLLSTVISATVRYEYRLTERWESTVQSFVDCDFRNSDFRARLLEGRAPPGVDPLLMLSMKPDVRDSLRYGDAPTESSTLLSMCKEKAATGDARAWIDVGVIYLAHDPKRAIDWLTAASEAGIVEADVVLGHAFRHGILGAVKSEKAAVTHYAKAAKAGSAKAQYYLGEILESTDLKLAARYYATAAQQGLLAASYRLQAPVWSGRLSPLSDHERYFWSLLFAAALKTGAGAYDSPLLFWAKDVNPYDVTLGRRLDIMFGPRQPPEECEFDGISGCRTMVVRYDVSDATRERARLEARLEIDRRSAIQERAARFIAQHIEAQPAPAIRAAPPVSNVALPPWKPLSAAVCSSAANTRVLDGSETYASIRPFVVTIEVSTINGTNSFGSGVAISEKEVISNCHVVQNAKTLSVKAEGRSMVGKVTAANEKADMCVVSVPGPLRYAKTGRKLSTLEIGETAYSLGHPQGLELTIANGIVSGVRSHEGRSYIQTTAPISQGSSGGALLDGRGNLLGITSFFLRSGQQINFAIPIESFCAVSR
jgi:serine protease Do